MLSRLIAAHRNVASARMAAEADGKIARQLGLTLVETLLAIGVGALVIIGAVAFYLNASDSVLVSQAADQTSAIVGGVRSLYGSTNTYATLTNSVAACGKVFPADMVRQPVCASVTNTDIINPWKGTVVLGGAASSFTLTYNGVPQSACTQMASTNAVGLGTGLVSVSVNGSVLSPPIDPGTAATACNVNTAAGNTIIYTAR